MSIHQRNMTTSGHQHNRPHSWLDNQSSRIYPNQDTIDHIYEPFYKKSIKSLRGKQNEKNFPGPSALDVPNSFLYHLLRIELWARWIGVNLLSKELITELSNNENRRKRFSILLWRMFLFIYMGQELILTAALILNGNNDDDNENEMLRLYMGDLFVLYGLHVDRFSLHAFKLCWGIHATFIYYWITSSDGKIRKWLINFDRRFMETANYVNKDLEPISQRRMYKGSRFARLFIHCSTILATITIALLTVLGYYTGEGRRLFHNSDHDDHFQSISLAIYVSWSIVHTIWFWLTFVINLTAFSHHFILCRAIHIRFEEIKNDLEYAVTSKRAIYTKPEDLSTLIVKHYYVCDMVKQANKHLKIYLFIFYVIFAPHLCFMIYEIIFSTNFTAQGRIILGFMLILSDFFQVYSVSVLSAQITSKSHEPYYTMHGVNKFENLPESTQLQSTLFMQRISNTVVGLTILDSFVLTGGLISSMLTAIITYFSVILENSS